MPRTVKKKNASAIEYSVHPGVALVQKWVNELKEKTGRSLDEWCKHITKDGPDDLAARRDWLKAKYKLGTNTAWWLAERADGQPTWDESPESYLSYAPQYVAAMFGGAKAGLLPAYEALIKLAQDVADDIKFCPCKTIVPFYRNHVIAEVKPAARTRIDFGFALGDLKGKGRLQETGGFAKKNRITHKIAISGPDDVDAEVRRWLQTAYERDAC
jgi:hypothetical protein